MSVQSKVARPRPVYTILSDDFETSPYRGSRSAAPLEDLPAFLRRNSDNYLPADATSLYHVSHPPRTNLSHYLSRPTGSDTHPRASPRPFDTRPHISDTKTHISVYSSDPAPPQDEVQML